jgi:hypothetical protein
VVYWLLANRSQAIYSIYSVPLTSVTSGTPVAHQLRSGCDTPAGLQTGATGYTGAGGYQ